MAYVISDEGAYRLGLVLLFGNDLYIPIYLQKLMLSLMKALTNLEKKKKKKGYLWWRHLQIRVSDTVQMWLMSIDILSHSSGKFYIYKYTSHGSSKFHIYKYTSHGSSKFYNS